jgi:deuterolysin
VYDLAAGGIVDLVSRGTLLHVISGTPAVNRILFTSNTLTVNINGPEAAATRQVQPAAPWKPDFVLEDGCTEDQFKMLEQARALCFDRADSAYKASHPDTANHAKMMEFFKDDSPEIRTKVSDGFYDIGTECESVNEGFTKQYCNDYRDCPPGVQATTHVSSTEVVVRYCPNYFDTDYKIDNPVCHEADKTLVMMHELAHAMMSVDDVAYEYNNFVKLNSTENLNNADTYAFFAKGKTHHPSDSWLSTNVSLQRLITVARVW